MATEVNLPALGESVTEGTVTRWLKSVGDEVAVDEPLLEVSTDKVDTEIPSPVAGTLLEIKVAEDETVEVGAELALVGSGAGGGGGGSAPSEAPAEDPTPQAPQEAEERGAPPEDQRTAQSSEAPRSEPEPRPNQPRPGEQPEQPPAPMSQRSPAGQPGGSTGERDGAADGGAYVTPLVRKLAAEHDVDLSSLEGTGVGGRIRKQDVLDAAKAMQAAQAAPAAQQPAAAGASQGGRPTA